MLLSSSVLTEQLRLNITARCSIRTISAHVLMLHFIVFANKLYLSTRTKLNCKVDKFQKQCVHLPPPHTHTHTHKYAQKLTTFNKQRETFLSSFQFKIYFIQT